MAELRPPPRDQRLDVLRGWMQVSIFVSHVAGTGFAWAIHAAWGLSDSSEQFVLLSGFGLGSVFALKRVRAGFRAAAADLWGRVARLWRTHLLVAVAFTALVLTAELTLPLQGEVARLGWRWLVEAPWAALPGLAAMLYQPEFTGILPVFVWCMLLLPGFLWLAGRVGAWALLPPVLLHAGVQAFGWGLPGLGGTEVAFNPLAWQLLFLTGAWFGRQALMAGRAVRPMPWVTAGAAAVVALGLYARLVGHGWLPDLGLDAMLLLGKTDLPYPRLLHALALAWLVAVLVPRDAPWMRGAAAGALATIGRHSLAVFCVGLFLSWGIGVAFRLHPGAVGWLDLLLVPAGAALLAAFARWADRGAAARRSLRTA
jgi:hypothetical protein